ncbi:hypothetical protein GCM10011326_44780 [Salipiger profundus]|nr:hypothetical protein GCM10011326_44780 [Salipiger profundus]
MFRSQPTMRIPLPKHAKTASMDIFAWMAINTSGFEWPLTARRNTFNREKTRTSECEETTPSLASEIKLTRGSG